MSLKLFELYKHIKNKDVGLVPLFILADDRQQQGIKYHVMWFSLTGKEPRALSADTVMIKYDDHGKWIKIPTKPYLRSVG